jgi:alpha-glucosidase
MMDFNFFGIPMTGADICGFIGDTTEELCARWIALGAFYPFSRDHNALGYAPQELYVWPTVTSAAQRALAMRYRMLPYLYTLFYAAHGKGSTVARPLWFNYPADEQCAGIVWQFMLGSSVLVSPVLEQGATSVSAYFPAGLWYDFEAMTLAVDAMEGGKWLTLDTPLEKSNVHIRGGSVLALHGADRPMTTHAARQAPFTVLVALCGMGMAKGEMFWDDGKQVELDETLSLSFYAEVKGEGTKKGRFTSTVEHSSYSTDSTIGAVTILGQGLTAPREVHVNGAPIAASDYTFDEHRGELTVAVTQPLTSALEVTWV